MSHTPIFLAEFVVLGLFVSGGVTPGHFRQLLRTSPLPALVHGPVVAELLHLGLQLRSMVGRVGWTILASYVPIGLTQAARHGDLSGVARTIVTMLELAATVHLAEHGRRIGDVVWRKRVSISPGSVEPRIIANVSGAMAGLRLGALLLAVV